MSDLQNKAFALSSVSHTVSLRTKETCRNKDKDKGKNSLCFSCFRLSDRENFRRLQVSTVICSRDSFLKVKGHI